MTPRLAIQMAAHECDGKSLNIMMRAANDIYRANTGDGPLPFPPVDVAFATFVDYMRESASQRERDLVLVSDKLTRVWSSLHITVQTLGEPLSASDRAELELVAPALKRLGLLSLITDELRTDLCERVQLAASH